MPPRSPGWYGRSHFSSFISCGKQRGGEKWILLRVVLLENFRRYIISRWPLSCWTSKWLFFKNPSEESSKTRIIMLWLLTLSFVWGSKPANNINKSDKLPLRFSRAFFLFSSIKRLFPSSTAATKQTTKHVAGCKLQDSDYIFLPLMCVCVDDTFKTSILIAPKLYPKRLLDSKLATTTATTTPSHPSPVCESRHQPPSKLGIHDGGLVHRRERKMLVETCGNIGRVSNPKRED